LVRPTAATPRALPFRGPASHQHEPAWARPGRHLCSSLDFTAPQLVIFLQSLRACRESRGSAAPADQEGENRGVACRRAGPGTGQRAGGGGVRPGSCTALGSSGPRSASPQPVVVVILISRPSDGRTSWPKRTPGHARGSGKPACPGGRSATRPGRLKNAKSGPGRIPCSAVHASSLRYTGLALAHPTTTDF